MEKSPVKPHVVTTVKKIRQHLLNSTKNIHGKLSALSSCSRYSGTKKQLCLSVRFMVFFSVSFLTIMLIIQNIPLRTFEEPLAWIMKNHVDSQGGYAWLTEEKDTIIVNVHNGPRVAVSFLCTGLLEFAVLTSALLASAGIRWRYRIYGVVLAVPFVFGINALRILISFQTILTSSVEFAEVVHNLFFRVALFISVAGFYGVWFLWVARKHTQ